MTNVVRHGSPSPAFPIKICLIIALLPVEPSSDPLLAAPGIDVNRASKNGETPLQAANEDENLRIGPGPLLEASLRPFGLSLGGRQSRCKERRELRVHARQRARALRAMDASGGGPGPRPFSHVNARLHLDHDVSSDYPRRSGGRRGRGRAGGERCGQDLAPSTWRGRGG